MKNVHFVVLQLLITIALWLVVDAVATHATGVRGFSQFLVSDPSAGHINKPFFSGRFGGFLDSFSSMVNIGVLGERKSSSSTCLNSQFILFMGDSSTAGFEVNDDETFVSRINARCRETAISGMNFGVRAHDSHSVLGNYERVAHLIKHDAVLYLITDNDLGENLRPYHYVNLVKRFGRVFDEKFFRPTMSPADQAYFAIRIFVSDRLYMTTKLLQVFEQWRATMREGGPTVHSISDDEAETLIRLVKRLSTSARRHNAKLYIAAYPCLHDVWCAGPETEQLLTKAAGATDEYVVLLLANELQVKFDNGTIKKEAMRFNNDGHLSKYGHQVVADELNGMFKAASDRSTKGADEN